VTFQVEQVLRGPRAGQRFSIREWPGLWVSGERYRVGQGMTLFLYPPSRVGFSSPVDGGAGRFKVDRDGQMQRSSPLFRLGGRDAFTVNGHFAHALVIINGRCAQTSAQLPDMKYQLVRVLGEVLGLGWSQLNLNVITGSPYPTSSDKAGFPVMFAFGSRRAATADVPLTARLLSNGAPISGKSISFHVLLGSGTPSPATATTDANGYARSTLHLSSLNADVQGSACLLPANNPCQTFYVASVASSLLKLENVSGSNSSGDGRSGVSGGHSSGDGLVSAGEPRARRRGVDPANDVPPEQ